MSTSLLAVGLKAYPKGYVLNSSSDSEKCYPGCVQLYHRGNYHWYLKQQFSGFGLQNLGFDPENARRIYLTQVGIDGRGERRSLVRLVEYAWDVSSSATPDASVAVVDGSNILLTPLGISTVPPPMSAFRHTLPAPCIHTYFWKSEGLEKESTEVATTDVETPTWGLACLCDGGVLKVIYANSRGKPVSFLDIDIPHSITKSCGASTATPLKCDDIFQWRAVCVSKADGINTLNIVLMGQIINSNVDAHTESNSDGIMHLVVDELKGTILGCRYILNRDNTSSTMSISRLVRWPGSSDFAVSLQTDLGFEVKRLIMSHSTPTGSESDKEVVLFEDALEDCGEHMHLPERCDHIMIVVDSMDSGDGRDINQSCITKARSVSADSADMKGRYCAVGLSARNRLYCGEVLLVAGASSFACNGPLGVLTYVTVGTKPHMHFVSVDALLGLSNLAGILAEESDKYTVEFAEPRPVERGSRLVTVVPGNPKVTVQMPRGNLESFEPRPLILMQATKLLDSNRYFECLVLLRRQKVDLNFIVDYSPELFLQNVETLVKNALSTNAELLSLLVSSLEPNNSSLFKYHFAVSMLKPGDVLTETDGDQKINTVCAAIRDVLLQSISTGMSKAQNPLLCTYAKQRPPLLEDALEMIAKVHVDERVSAVAASLSSSAKSAKSASSAAAVPTRAAVLASNRVQSSIKYLAFLADGQHLFDAALGQCDYAMARAVARQCQMDPKHYMPLLEGFESIGKVVETVAEKGIDSVSMYRNMLMRFHVNHHLHRHEKCVEYAAKTFGRAVEVLETGVSGMLSDKELAEIEAMARKVFDVVVEKKIQAHAIQLIASIKWKCASAKVSEDDAAIFGRICESINKLLRKLRGSFGAQCASEQLFNEAVSSYLAAEPPFIQEAIRAARQDGNWQLALTIAGQYWMRRTAKNGTDSGSSGADDEVPTAVHIAQEIVSAFRASLEQGESEDSFGGLGLGCGEPIDGGMTADKAMEAAQISLDFCNDAEGAVAILVGSRHWTEAIKATIRSSRNDLLFEEIAPAIRGAAADLLAKIERRKKRHTELVTDLNLLWGNAEERLQKVGETEPTMLAEIERAANEELYGPEDGHDDNKSEFSLASFRSGASNLSNISYISASSAASAKSGTSTVSVLSNISLSQESTMSSKKSEMFSIEGLDHSLLSRGNSRTVKKESDRHQRKKDKKRYKFRGEGPDVCGLRREKALADEMWTMADFTGVARQARSLCDALLVLGGDMRATVSGVGGAYEALSLNRDLQMACTLQATVDAYGLLMQSQVAPVAPAYPPQWLTKRQMSTIMRFQEKLHPTASTVAGTDQAANTDSEAKVADGGQGAEGAAANSAEESTRDWWQTAAQGLMLWKELRLVTLQTAKDV
jgi:hypothetical protein